MEYTSNLHTNIWHLSTGRAVFFSIITLDHNVSMIPHQKLHTLNYKVFDHPLYSLDLSPTDFHFFKDLDNFLQEKCFRNPKDAEKAFNEFAASRTTTFYNTGIKKVVSLCKSALRLTVCILINKLCSVKIYSFFK